MPSLRRFYALGRVIRLVIWLAFLCGFLRPVSAQTSQPGAIPNAGGGDVTPPVVTITPASLSTSNPNVSFTVDWCDNVSLWQTTALVTLNGTSVPISYTTSTKAGCGAHATSTGSVTLAVGTNTLVAKIMDLARNQGSKSATYTYTPTATYGVSVLPHAQPVTAKANRSNSYSFTVTNTGNAIDTVDLVRTCTGTAFGCSAPTTPVVLPVGGADTATITYNADSGGTTGAISLAGSVRGHSVADTGSIDVTSQWVKALLVSTAFNNNDNQNMAACDHMCFAVSYQQSTVPYFSLGTAHSVTVLYQGDRVAVRPFIYADVNLDTTQNPYPVVQYWLEATVNGGPVTFLNGETRLHFRADSLHPGNVVRLAGQFDGSAYATGVYPMVITVTAEYVDHTETWDNSAAGDHLLIVNERKSPIARGWTLDGVPHLYPTSAASALITDGDGSAIYFQCSVPTSPCPSFITPAGDFSRLTVTGTGSAAVYVRSYVDSTKEVFNSVGLLTARINRVADTASFSYDSAGRLSAITDAILPSTLAHRGYWLTYGTYGLKTANEPGFGAGGSGGRQTTFTVGADSTLQAIVDPDGVSTQFRYDARRRLTIVIDRRGDTTQFTYRSDSSWKIASAVFPRVPVDNNNGGTSLATPTASYVPWQIVGVPTGATSVTPATPVTPSGVVGVATDPGGHSSAFTVDRWGEWVTVTHPLGQVTTYIRSGMLPVKVVYPSGVVDSMGYTSNGLINYSAVAGEATATIAYGAFGLPTQISGPHRSTQTIVYGAGGRDSIETLGTSIVHHYQDRWARDTLVIDALGRRAHFHYDPIFGNQDSVLSPGNRWTAVRYDHHGRDSVQLTSLGRRDTLTYDVLNRVTRTTNPTGGAATANYDGLYLIRIQDPKGQVYRVDVDAAGRVSRRYDPADTVGRYISYRYNIDGKITSWTNRRGQSVTVAYDSLHRIIAETGPTISADSFAYSPDSKIFVGWNSVSRDSIFTDGSGLVTGVTSWINGKRFANLYFETDAFQPSWSTIISNTNIVFTSPVNYWNATNAALDSIYLTRQLDSAHLNIHPRIRFGADKSFQADSTIWPGSVRQAELHTTASRLYSSRFSSASVDTAMARNYATDSLNRITQIASNRPVVGLDDRFFAYDAAGHLSSTSDRENSAGVFFCTAPADTNYGPDCRVGNPNTTETFAKDAVGNDTLLSSADTHYTAISPVYGTGNRLQTWGTVQYTTDADGNVIRRLNGTQDIRYGWSADGHLVSDTVLSNGRVIQYQYNAFGQLVRRLVNGNPDRIFLWDRGNLRAELDGTGSSRIAEYVYMPHADEPIAIVTGATAITGFRFLAQDALNNIIGVFDSTGVVAQRLAYRSWGVIDSAGSSLGTLADTNRLRWKGLLWEGDSTRLYYVRNRWYDPVTGRFLSEDPNGLGGGINLYAFSNSDPVNGIDPSGLKEDDGSDGGADEGCPSGTTELGRVVDAETGNVLVECQNDDGSVFDIGILARVTTYASPWVVPPEGVTYYEGVTGSYIMGWGPTFGSGAYSNQAVTGKYFRFGLGVGLDPSGGEEFGAATKGVGGLGVGACAAAEWWLAACAGADAHHGLDGSWTPGLSPSPVTAHVELTYTITWDEKPKYGFTFSAIERQFDAFMKCITGQYGNVISACY